ncbi:MAG: T9SS type A sorting domain-containing protein [Ignavibacteriales bacterium]|nr:T9SS type A sorting domain-containing protein [Ignavibacteriales bacterium]
MKKVFTIFYLFILLIISSYSQSADTIKYNWYMDIPGFGLDNVASGIFLEGQHMTLEPTTLPPSAARYQCVFDALVGSELGFEDGAINNNIEINVMLKQLDQDSCKFEMVVGNTVFLYMEVEVLDQGVYYSVDSSYYFKNGKKAYLIIPLTEAFKGFCTNVGINVYDGVSFVYVINDPITGLPRLVPNGLTWAMEERAPGDTVINLRLEHFSKFGGGGKTLVTKVEDQNNKPTVFNLAQNYPNPFNPSTKISFSLPSDGYVSLKLYNTLGSEVETLSSEFKKAGNYEVTFNASRLNSGVYFYTLRYNNLTQSRKMILIK